MIASWSAPLNATGLGEDGMSRKNYHDYYQARAMTASEMALQAADERVAARHRAMAAVYLRLAKATAANLNDTEAAERVRAIVEDYRAGMG